LGVCLFAGAATISTPLVVYGKQPGVTWGPTGTLVCTSSGMVGPLVLVLLVVAHQTSSSVT
jgi:hypothetical protein